MILRFGWAAPDFGPARCEPKVTSGLCGVSRRVVRGKAEPHALRLAVSQVDAMASGLRP